MAFTYIADRGNAESKASSTDLVGQVNADIVVGRILVVRTLWDNTATSTGPSTNIDTVTDEQGNTYTKFGERTISAGAAEDGLTAAMFIGVITTQLNNGDDVTITADTARVAKVASFEEFSKDSGTTLALEGAYGFLDGASGQPGNVTVSSLTSREYLLIQMLGCQIADTQTMTPDADYTQGVASVGTAGGVSATNVTLHGSHRIATLTSDGSDPSTSAGSSHTQLLFPIYEVGGGATELEPASLSHTRGQGTPAINQRQIIVPTADSSDGAWTDAADGNTNLFSNIDESNFNDSDFIKSETSPSNSGVRFKLNPAALDPLSSAGHEIHWRIAKDTTGGETINMTVQIRQGGGNVLGAGTLIASFARNDVSSTLTTFVETLSGAEADSITNYVDLFIEFYANQV